MNVKPAPLKPILLVDDEEQALASYDLNLRYCGLSNTVRCSDPREAARLLETREFSLVLLDLCMPHLPGEDLLGIIRSRHRTLPVIVVTGENDVDTAVRCMRAGSIDYLVKPLDRAHLLSAVRRALDSAQAKPEPKDDKLRQTNTEAPFARIVTQNRRMREIMAYASAVAASGEPVLVAGETGVGKEMVARAIHELSGVSGKFVGVNVAGLDDAMFSDSLFGHVKGAFTGAQGARPGLIEEASQGSLFLDEIGDLNPQSQLKLLRLIQEREYYPLGSDCLKPMQARLIVATNQPLDELRQSGKFREDLFFRLRTHYLLLPPLRERKDDIEPLTRHFLGKAAKRLGRETPNLGADALELLCAHAYPGNVRELEAMLFNAVALSQGSELALGPLREWIAQVRGIAINPETLGLFPAVSCAARLPTLKQAEEQIINQALRLAKDNQSQAAKLLGITRQALNRRLLGKQRRAKA